MSAILYGVPGKLKTLLDRLTSARAAKIDNLDAAVTTRAPASTAMSNAVWTDARAAKLDNVTQTDDPLLSPPIVSGIIPAATSGITVPSAGIASQLAGISNTNTTSTSYVDAVNYTGQGVLEFLAFQTTDSAQTATLKITVDGVVVAENALSAAIKFACVVGVLSQVAASTYFVAGLSQVPFRQSLQIQIKTNNASYTTRSYFRYRKTA